MGPQYRRGESRIALDVQGQDVMGPLPAVAWADQRQLIKAAQCGNREAFDQLVQACGKGLYSQCFRVLGNAEDARDAVQDTLYQTLRSIRTYRGEGTFGAWLRRAALYRCLNILRERKRNGIDHQNIRLMSELPRAEDDDSGAEMPDEAPAVEEAVVQAVYVEQLRQAVLTQAVANRWNENDYRLFRLRIYQGMSFPDIAAWLGDTDEHWRSRFHEKIRPTLKQVGSEPGVRMQ